MITPFLRIHQMIIEPNMIRTCASPRVENFAPEGRKMDGAVAMATTQYKQFKILKNIFYFTYMYICLTYNKICKQDLEIQQSLLEIFVSPLLILLTILRKTRIYCP